MGRDKRTPVPELAEQFHRLFDGLPRAYGTYEMMERPTGGAKVQGKARTVRSALTVGHWEKHLLGVQGVGVVPIRDDGTVLFAAVDVDKYSLDLATVEAKVAELGLPLLPTRTKSGGVHLYMFGAEPLSAALVRTRLDEWSVVLGFGGAEVFPKQNALASEEDVGNWINMPYYGYCETENYGTTQRYGIFNGQELTATGFLQRAEQLRVTTAQLKSLDVKPAAEFVDGPPCLQSLAQSGFGSGMRNNGLFAVGVYLKKRYPDDWKSYLHVYNTTFMKPPLEEIEVRGLQKQLSRKDYTYSCDKPPIKKYCNRTLCRTREFGIGKDAEDWGIVIDNDMRIVQTKPPYYLVTVNGTQMTLTSEHLVSQHAFIKLCCETIYKKPAKLPADKWDAEVNRLFTSAQKVEAPEDASASGELAYFLQQYCTVYPQAETREELLVGKPFTEEGLTHFRAADFKKFLESQHFRALTGPRLYSAMKELGVAHKQYWVGGRNVLVWAVHAFNDDTPTVPSRSDDSTGEM